MSENSLAAGDKAPAFKGDTATGPLASKDLKGERYVLYFYPKDDTPGCTTEACGFRDNLPQFKRLGVKVFGVSKDDLKSHAKFVDKYELPFTLISDSDGSICESFGVWGEKSLYGRKYMGIERATFLIGPGGDIEKAWRNVKVKGHIDEIIEVIKSSK